MERVELLGAIGGVPVQVDTYFSHCHRAQVVKQGTHGGKMRFKITIHILGVQPQSYGNILRVSFAHRYQLRHAG